MHLKQPHIRFCEQGSGGPHFIRMLKNIVRNVLFVKGWEIHPEGMRCLHIYRLHCRHLINGK
jgi:hypothetical protein